MTASVYLDIRQRFIMKSLLMLLSSYSERTVGWMFKLTLDRNWCPIADNVQQSLSCSHAQVIALNSHSSHVCVSSSDRDYSINMDTFYAGGSDTGQWHVTSCTWQQLLYIYSGIADVHTNLVGCTRAYVCLHEDYTYICILNLYFKFL
jgi:hypothetical protein